MYNRYIPRGDGTYICRQEPDFETEHQETPPPPEPEIPEPHQKKDQKSGGFPFNLGSLDGITGKIRGLLPKGMDIGDIILLLILILLLLDGEDDEMLWVLLIMLIL